MSSQALKEEVAPEAQSNVNVKDYIKRLRAVNKEIRKAKDVVKEANDSRKDLLKEAESNGVSKKELVEAVKLIEFPLSDEFKSLVNFYIESTGQMAFFA